MDSVNLGYIVIKDKKFVCVQNENIEVVLHNGRIVSGFLTEVGEDFFTVSSNGDDGYRKVRINSSQAKRIDDVDICNPEDISYHRSVN